MVMHLAMLIFSEILFQGISEELLLSATRVVDKELTVKTIVCHLCSCVTLTFIAVAKTMVIGACY